MTCGVYLLKFNGTDKVYIGQSVNIESRKHAHRSLASRGIHAEKLQKAFSTYGSPELHILEECTKERLDSLEKTYIEEFNAVEDGFNTARTPGGGHSLYGDSLTHSKFSNEQIEEAFLMLVNNGSMTSKEISEVTGVSKATVDSLSSVPRAWLKDKYPEEYNTLSSRSSLRFGKGKTLKERGIVYPPIISPEGVSYIVDNTSQFAKEHGLNNAHLVQVLRGKEKQHKGWKLDNGRP